ncbi:MAG: uracil DNA glycosylase [Geoglossum umbratile]|nr:MAG: uracil DNA glycosylase [Geoglossum umbratile]
MESVATITHHPSDLLREVGASMNWRHPEISVTVPMVTTWKAALSATQSALGEVDETVIITRIRSKSERQILRQVALENVQADNSSSSAGVCSIRTAYDITSLPYPKLSSESTRKKLKENAAKTPHFSTDPYPFSIRATITKRTLPVLKGNLILRGIDYSNDDDPREVLSSVDMLWDTGAQQTIITEELLSESFRQHLKDTQHDPYRSKDGLRVQMDAAIGFSNTPITLTAIVLIVPKSTVPNERVGILFGQQQCIDHISYRSIPRRILKGRGEDIGEEMWGDIVLDEFIDVNDETVSL